MKFDELYKQILGENTDEVQNEYKKLKDSKVKHADNVEKAAREGKINKQTGEVESDDVDNSLEDVKKSTEETARAIKKAAFKK